MSLLRYPRIYFTGEVSWDPGVTNNDPSVYDAENASVVLPPGMTLAQFKRRLPAAAAAGGSWNHFGTHAAVFENVNVTGASLGFKQAVVTQDPLVGRTLKLAGKLVDLDAASVTGSQIFFDELILGDTTAGLRARRSRRLHARHINFGRNQGGLDIAGNAGVGWNTVLRKQDSQLFGAGSSAIMTALSTAMQDPDALGIFIRFHTYRTLYFQNGTRNSIFPQPNGLQQLRDFYAQGENFSNPAYSAMAGVIGIWTADQAQSALSGRFLPPAGAGFGPAFAEVDETARRLVIDLGQTIPERDANLEKVDFGPLALKLRTQSGEAVLLSIPFEDYSRASYDRTAGLVEIDLASLPADTMANLSSGNLSLTFESGGNSQPVVAESLFSALADDRDIYLDQNETKFVPIAVLLRGKRAPAGTLVRVFQFDRSVPPATDKGAITADGNGVAQFQVSATQAGFVTFVFIPYAPGSAVPPAPADFDPAQQAYINVRTLPFDDALAQSTPDTTLTWSWVYENILGTYDVINSVMSRTSNPAINKPLDNQQQMELFADAIKQATSRTRFESARYMPITRDMSAGKRTLLHRWCDLIISGNAPQDAIPHFFVPAGVADGHRDFRMAKPLTGDASA